MGLCSQLFPVPPKSLFSRVPCRPCMIRKTPPYRTKIIDSSCLGFTVEGRTCSVSDIHRTLSCRGVGSNVQKRTSTAFHGVQVRNAREWYSLEGKRHGQTSFTCLAEIEIMVMSVGPSSSPYRKIVLITTHHVARLEPGHARSHHGSEELSERVEALIGEYYHLSQKSCTIAFFPCIQREFRIDRGCTGPV
ncbi:hypothetical protein PM082_000170 [Marasmius tenuissimus]|nr:hypothetical protein PM082_000170 [Marasmius tenuissimus]